MLRFLASFVRAEAPPTSSLAAIVIWDIENVRLPTSLPPGAVFEALRRRFGVGVDGPVRIVCCVTPRSLPVIERRCPAFLASAVPAQVEVRVASATRQKLGADFVLKTEMAEFMQLHASSCLRIDEAEAAPRIVLMTGDADFLEPMQRAVRLGFDVRLVHYAGNSSRALVNGWTGLDGDGPVEWARMLADELNGGADVALPYVDKEDEERALADAKAREQAREAAAEERRGREAAAAERKAAVAAAAEERRLARVREDARKETIRLQREAAAEERVRMRAIAERTAREATAAAKAAADAEEERARAVAAAARIRRRRVRRATAALASALLTAAFGWMGHRSRHSATMQEDTGDARALACSAEEGARVPLPKLSVRRYPDDFVPCL